MPPCNGASLAALARALLEAARTQEWEQMARLDAQLAAWLAWPGARDAQLRAAWLQLRQAHGQALRACQDAKAEAAQRLLALQREREAQQAYAWQEILG